MSRRTKWKPLPPTALDALVAAEHPPKKPSKRSIRLAKKTTPGDVVFDDTLDKWVWIEPQKPPRKPRNRPVHNTWSIKRLLATDQKCAQCKRGTRVAGIKHRVHKLLFNPLDMSAVLCQIWTLRQLGFSYELVYHVMNAAHMPSIVLRENLRSLQVRPGCGCVYHMSCYEKRLKGHFCCDQHHARY
jgi:hypothetical protein